VTNMKTVLKKTDRNSSTPLRVGKLAVGTQINRSHLLLFTFNPCRVDCFFGFSSAGFICGYSYLTLTKSRFYFSLGLENRIIIGYTLEQ